MYWRSSHCDEGEGATIGYRLNSVFTKGLTGGYPASGAETMVITTPPFNPPADNTPVFVSWYVLFGTGTGTTLVTMRLYRGTTILGTVINASFAQAVTAAAGWSLAGTYVDTPGAVGGVQYGISLQGTGTTGAMIQEDGYMMAWAL